MERRFVLFLTVAMFILLANAWWTISHMPPPQEKPPVDAQADAAPKGADKRFAAVEKGAGADDEPAEQAPAAGEPEDVHPRQYVTLGSLDPKSPYRMLATLTNEGAGVRRIELASSRYLDLYSLEQRIGYLGHLELAPERGGLRVGAVGLGTPAAAAGLLPGDLVVAAGTKEVKPVASLKEFAEATRGRSKAEVTLRIDRAGVEQELKVKLVRRPLEVVRPESENVRLWKDDVPADYAQPPSFRVTTPQIGDETLADLHKQILKQAEQRGEAPGELPAELPGVDLMNANWRLVEQTEESATFERRLPKHGLTVVKRYRLAKLPAQGEGAPAGSSSLDAPAYHLMLELSIRNDGPAERKIAYALDGPNGLPIEGWWYANKTSRNWGAAGLRDVIGRFYRDRSPLAPQMVAPATIAEGKAQDFQGGSIDYMGVDAQYFSVALIPQKKTPDEIWIERVQPLLLGPRPVKGSVESRYANVSCRMFSEAESVAPGGSISHEYQVFAGPKRPDLLTEYKTAGGKAPPLGDLVYYGWYSGIARAMLGILHFFYGIVGNYGLAIIMLTVLVRGLMFPISRSQAKSMANMQLLKPEMDRIKERYKGDQQKQAAAMQDLYRKHGVNPLAGCLPMLIQLPVFVGLYKGLSVDIELRQAPLFGSWTRWCSNLAAPDMLLDWSGFMPDAVNRGEAFIIGLGPYLNVLPLVTMGLFLLQQKMFMPEPTNEQAALQQKMMKYMMVFMGLMFYKVPSGLCLYFIASSLWGIAERKLIGQSTPPEPGKSGEPAKSEAPPRDRKRPAGKTSKKRR
ncbi:MAG: YidC/Oxa1 family insertase periplasmic-domain containing protein [Pirellulales bacterium]|nr:YidC/Oxa1 family insertase periplasmic-domain containing protein [Pirellulales bacterium]